MVGHLAALRNAATLSALHLRDEMLHFIRCFHHKLFVEHLKQRHCKAVDVRREAVFRVQLHLGRHVQVLADSGVRHDSHFDQFRHTEVSDLRDYGVADRSKHEDVLGLDVPVYHLPRMYVEKSVDDAERHLRHPDAVYQ